MCKILILIKKSNNMIGSELYIAKHKNGDWICRVRRDRQQICFVISYENSFQKEKTHDIFEWKRYPA